MAVPAAESTRSGRSVVVAELPRRASLRLRLAHRLSFAVLRTVFDLFAAVDRRGLVSAAVLQRMLGLFDPFMIFLRPRRGTRRRRVAFENFRAEWLWDDAVGDPEAMADPAAILFFHGGGFVTCGLNTHRRLAARIARVSGLPLFSVDYRQVPRARIAETVQDALESYRFLLNRGFPGHRVILAGDSAGGGLAFTLALAIRDAGLPMPAAVSTMAPWADYHSTRRFEHPNDRTDAYLSAAVFGRAVEVGDGRRRPGGPRVVAGPSRLHRPATCAHSGRLHRGFA